MQLPEGRVPGFFHGAQAVFRGFRHIRNSPGLGVIVLTPMLLTGVTYVFFFFVALAAWGHYQEELIQSTDSVSVSEGEAPLDAGTSSGGEGTPADSSGAAGSSEAESDAGANESLPAGESVATDVTPPPDDGALAEEGSGWLKGFLRTGGWILFAIVFFVTSYFTFLTVGSLFCAPFNDILSQRVERAILGESAVPDGGRLSFITDALRSIVHELKRLSVYFLLLLVCLPALLIPFLFSALMAYISVRYLAWDGLDYCMGRRRWSYSRKTEFLKRHRAVTVGFGTSSFLLLLVPLTALFVLPLNAVGGTVLFCELFQSDDKES